MNHKALKALAVAGTLMVLAAAGCTDTTVQPKSTVATNNVFNDPSSYQSFLARIYAGLAVSGQQGPAGNADIQGIDEGFSQYMRLYWELEELPTDAAVIGWGDIGLPEMNTMTWTSSSTMVVAMYYRIYVQAAMANEFLRQTTAAALASRVVSPTLKANIQTYRAEARFLRALSYYHALDLFGNVPLVTEADPIGGAPPKQVTRDSLYRFVVREATAIHDSLLVGGTAASYGRATQGADDMLLAELYLNKGVFTGTTAYDSALAAASRVIAGPYSLDPTWRRMFSADNGSSPEIIFMVESNTNVTQTYGGVTFLIHASCGGKDVAANYGIDYCWGGTRLKPETYNLFAAGDTRSAFFYHGGTSVDSLQKVSVDTLSNFQDGIAAPKFTNAPSTGTTCTSASNCPTFVNTNFPIWRLSEAYLIYAEANLRGGGGSQATALGYVNAIRERAYGGVAGDITAGQLTLQFVLDERGRELMWEAHRRTDLVRYGMFAGAAYIWGWKGGNPNGFFQTGVATPLTYNLYPLPASELVANPNLTQNPGY